MQRTDLREKPLHAAAKMPKERPADVRHQVQASPSNRVSNTYLQEGQPGLVAVTWKMVMLASHTHAQRLKGSDVCFLSYVHPCVSQNKEGADTMT